MEKAIELGAQKIVLTVCDENLAAVSLYQKLGFEIEGKLRKHFKTTDGRLLDELVMSYFPNVDIWIILIVC